MSEQYLYFAKRPPLEELEAVTLICRTVSNTTPFLQMKCRELARADVNCVITPVPSTNDNTAWAIAKVGYFTDCSAQQKLSQIGFEITSRSPVTAETLQRCYQFSVMARMAPKWNRIGQHLVQGCEFFCSGKTCYVGLDVNVTATEIIVALEAGQIKFTFLTPEDLTTTPSLLQQYKSGLKEIITEASLENRRCILLPNCTRGCVYSVSTTTPASREFSTYSSLRMHWKKHHGFVLPEHQSTFYQIYFAFKPSQLLSYPGCCVLQYPPITYKCNNPAAICAAFVGCLHSRLPALCGYPLNYSTRLLQPDVGLTTALQSQTFVNLLHVGRKPAGVGVVCKAADSSSPVLNSNCVAKPDHPYIPIFNSSLVSGKVSREGGPQGSHPQFHSNVGKKILTTASNDVSVEQGSVSNHSHMESTTTTYAVPNKASSSSNDRICDSNYLITQISRQKVATLKKWLAMNNVKFKAKSNKDDLIKLVITHIKDVRRLLALSSEE